MIGHYLLALTRDAEEALLTQPFRGRLLGEPQSWGGSVERCLVERAGTTNSEVMLCWPYPVADEQGNYTTPAHYTPGNAVPCRYDRLCRRFGTPRVNAAIRNRILSNRARRALQPQYHDVQKEFACVATD